MTKLRCRSDIMLHFACQKLKRKSNLNCKILRRFVTADDFHVTLNVLTESPRRKFDLLVTQSKQIKHNALSFPKRITGEFIYKKSRKSDDKKLRITCASHILQENKLSASKLMFINNSTRDVLATIQFNIFKFTQIEPDITKTLDA